MFWIFIIVSVIFICFAGVVLVGAPYIPTLSPQVNIALDLVKLKPDETLLELGCGDGKILIAAAEKGYKVIGYEINPILAIIAWIRTRKYGKNVRIIWGDYWHQAWPPANAIFVFLLSKYMLKLDKKIIQYPHKPIKLVSFAFTIPDREIAKEKRGVFLYKYN
ncbi:MAG TPA: methyltransferase domain-containing protein [Candidatus Saccharimonadales bacterium]|nr:methyltransferase domain-containing protein [Candidatus Saccharimonadales bacterium]